MGDELDNDFRVRGGLEVGSGSFELFAQVAEVDQVAVVGDGDQALGRIDPDRLSIQKR